MGNCMASSTHCFTHTICMCRHWSVQTLLPRSSNCSLKQKCQYKSVMHEALPHVLYITNCTFPQAPSLPLTLPYLSRSDPPSLRASAQRLVHSYPSDVWSLAVLMHSIEQEAVKNKYRAVVLQYSKPDDSKHSI